jgi:processive 1,2-diacylglycerol beta-glucosyltransferase
LLSVIRRKRDAHGWWNDAKIEPMIDLYDDATNTLIGSITEADLQVLVDALEEESLDDHDYYIDAATVDVIADGRATEHLVNLLRAALGAKDGIDIRWQRR